MKYILKKQIEGIDWEVGEIKESKLGYLDIGIEEITKVELHNLLLNGTIEKVEENKRWRADNGQVYWVVKCNSLNTFVNSYEEIGCNLDNDYYNSYNYFQTESQAQAVADKIKQLLKESHESTRTNYKRTHM